MSLPKLVLLDLDGTLYIDGKPIAGAVDAVNWLRGQGCTIRFLTNTTTRARADLYAMLADMGLSANIKELVSTPAVAVLELEAHQQRLGRPLKLWPVVAEAIQTDFAGFIRDEVSPDVVVLGDIGDAWSFDLINRLFAAMHQGAALMALHRNRFWQTQNALKVDIGFFVAGLEYVTGQPPVVMGKPSPAFFSRVLADVGVTADQVLLVGDDIDSDVGGAQAQGIAGVLVQTGKYRAVYAAQSEVMPSGVIGSIADLPAYLTQPS